MKDNTYQSTLDFSNTSKIEQLINENKLNEALMFVEDDDLIQKGIIYDKLSEFDKALEYFDKALTFKQDNKTLLLKSNTLFNYAKTSYFPDCEYEKALSLIDKALDTIPENENVDEYYFLKAEILESLGNLKESHKYYLLAHREFEKLKEFEKQKEYIDNTPDILINITGGYFYDFTPTSGLIVDLIKEEDNEHDSDAIAVLLNDEKVGYVANSDYTLMDGAKSASEIKNKINNNSKAEILFVYLDYVVGKLVI